MPQSQTLYWHDYETFGTDPQRDRPSQFAGLRTDLDLNIISDPLVLYCQPSADTLPQPEACLITGITPQIAMEKGVPEFEFIDQVHQQFSLPDTCSLGYNTLRFDDEISRNVLYRNFYDPYAREWQNGNSRWDIIDLTRMTYALRPDGIQWPRYDSGDACFRLEKLTEENDIGHESAHDALSDVKATIEWARLIKNKQPRLYEYLFNLRNKHQVAKLLNVMNPKPLVHVSSKYPAKRYSSAVILPLITDPKNNNAIVVFDLMQDAELLLDLSVDEIKQRVFTSADELPEGMDRIALKTVHINKCPALSPIKTLRLEDQDRLGIDLSICEKNRNKLLNNKNLKSKILQVFEKHDYEAIKDPDLMIYSGGFFNNNDKVKISEVRSSTAEQLVDKDFGFQDSRLDEMLFRYRARNFPHSLNDEESLLWKSYCQKKLTSEEGGGSITLKEFENKLEVLVGELTINKETDKNLIDNKLKILNELKDYKDTLKQQFQL